MEKFSVENAFFIIDSEDLLKVQTAFYGYSIVKGQVLTKAEQLARKKLSGDGTYVFIHRHWNRITVGQDFIGSYGLYLYENGGRFVLSNSFLLLAEYLTKQAKLTFNSEAAMAFIADSICNTAFSQTLIKEIRLLPRNAVVTINVKKRKLRIDSIDYRENTLKLGTNKGIAVLDSWYEKWTRTMRTVASTTEYVRFDLSGGFDSRMVFCLLLGSGIDLQKVKKVRQ